MFNCRNSLLCLTRAELICPLCYEILCSLCIFQDLFLLQESTFEENEDTPKIDIASITNVNSDDLATRYKHIEEFFLFESSKAKDNGIIDMEFSCANCVNVKKVLKTSTQAPMSNLRAHLRKIHPDLMGRFDSLLRSGFCDLNFLSILSDFLSREKKLRNLQNFNS